MDQDTWDTPAFSLDVRRYWWCRIALTCWWMCVWKKYCTFCCWNICVCVCEESDEALISSSPALNEQIRDRPAGCVRAWQRNILHLKELKEHLEQKNDHFECCHFFLLDHRGLFGLMTRFPSFECESGSLIVGEIHLLLSAGCSLVLCGNECPPQGYIITWIIRPGPPEKEESSDSSVFWRNVGPVWLLYRGW